MPKVEKDLHAFDDWLTILKYKLPLIGFRRNLTFAASCCQRAIPNYALFARQAHWGDHKLLMKALAVIWGSVLEPGAKPNDSYATALLKAIASITPDTETPFESQLTSAALDACVSVSEVLSYTNDEDSNHILTVSSLARDTIYLYVQYTENSDYSNKRFEETILSHPLMIAEMKEQQDDFQILASNTSEAPEFWLSFRDRAQRKRTSNLGLSL